MDDRIVEFIAALRAAGVRVSIAESEDSMRAVEQLGIANKGMFRSALRSTLVKDIQDYPDFDRLFPLYFGGDTPLNAIAGMNPHDREMLEAALEEVSRQLADRLRRLLMGQGLTREELQRIAQAAAQARDMPPELRFWLMRQLQRELGIEQLQKALQALMRQLQAAGMDPETLERLRQAGAANQRAMQDEIERAFQEQGSGKDDERNRPFVRGPRSDYDLMQRPFNTLTPAEIAQLRKQVRRLAARLRSRAALRHKRGKVGQLDSKATLRASLKTYGIPLELRWRKRHLKPKLALICDISTSMRPVADFLLRLMYELQDQVSRARSFAFISDIQEISSDFAHGRPEAAILGVLDRMPSGHYNTDLGTSLATFCRDHLDAVDRRTTVIVLGDGRNNFNDPRMDCFDLIRNRARRLIWLNPEATWQWGSGDSDMLEYAPRCSSVHQVSNLAELTDAVDEIL
jgi:uncharacterized protein with von Willebrand factor type A (vWA) domain